MSPDGGAGENEQPRWQELAAAQRLAVDQSFTDQVAASGLSKQSWELAMTAVELEIRSPSDPETAELVADTDRLPSVLPAIASIERRAPTKGGRGWLDRLRDRIPGLRGPVGDQRRTAEALAETYATALQEELQAAGRWETVCEVAETADTEGDP